MLKLKPFVAVVVAGLFHATGASAVPVWFAEVKTSDWLGDFHGTLTVPTDPGNLAALVHSSDLHLDGDGLGSGYVSTASGPLEITHTFAPVGYSVNDVLGASVLVSVIDDLDLSRETGELRIGSTVLDSGNALANLFDGDVSAWIEAAGDSVTLQVRSTRGDFRVLFSAMSVHFDGTAPVARRPVPAMPEPSAAIVFALGLFVAGRWSGRGRRSH